MGPEDRSGAPIIRANVSIHLFAGSGGCLPCLGSAWAPGRVRSGDAGRAAGRALFARRRSEKGPRAGLACLPGVKGKGGSACSGLQRPAGEWRRSHNDAPNESLWRAARTAEGDSPSGRGTQNAEVATAF